VRFKLPKRGGSHSSSETTEILSGEKTETSKDTDYRTTVTTAVARKRVMATSKTVVATGNHTRKSKHQGLTKTIDIIFSSPFYICLY